MPIKHLILPDSVDVKIRRLPGEDRFRVIYRERFPQTTAAEFREITGAALRMLEHAQALADEVSPEAGRKARCMKVRNHVPSRAVTVTATCPRSAVGGMMVGEFGQWMKTTLDDLMAKTLAKLGGIPVAHDATLCDVDAARRARDTGRDAVRLAPDGPDILAKDCRHAFRDGKALCGSRVGSEAANAPPCGLCLLVGGKVAPAAHTPAG